MDITKLISIAQSAGVIAAVLFAAYILFRSRTAEVLRGERDAFQEKCERLVIENTQLVIDSSKKDVIIADLTARTDLTDIRGSLAAITIALTNSEKHLTQMTGTLEAMEKRLDRGLVMG